MRLLFSLIAIHIALNVAMMVIHKISHPGSHKRRNLIEGDTERIEYIIRDLFHAPDRRKHNDTDKHFS